MRVLILCVHAVIVTAALAWLDNLFGGSGWFGYAIPVIFAAWIAIIYYGDHIRAAALRRPRLFRLLLP